MADRLSQLMSEIQALLNGDESEPEDMQAIYDEELQLRYNPANFGESIPPEVMDIISGIVDPGGKAKGLGSMMDDLFDIMKRGREMGKTSVKRSKESEKYWDDAADRSKQARSDRIARENIEESRRSVSEATTPEGTIRIERTVNPKTGWRHDDPPKKLKGGGHLSYKKGYYGKRYN
jgi:siroheme synthase (precorrin-2 oxidase/ferrochelatase)